MPDKRINEKKEKKKMSKTSSWWSVPLLLDVPSTIFSAQVVVVDWSVKNKERTAWNHLVHLLGNDKQTWTNFCLLNIKIEVQISKLNLSMGLHMRKLKPIQNNGMTEKYWNLPMLSEKQILNTEFVKSSMNPKT